MCSHYSHEQIRVIKAYFETHVKTDMSPSDAPLRELFS